MKKILKGLAVLIILVICGFVLVYHEVVSYGIKQAKGQLHIIWNAKPVQEFLDDPNYPDSLKLKLQLIEDVRRYAFDELNLKENENYTKMFDQGGNELMWVVTASHPYKLEPYQWHFPLLGSLSYKGFFNPELARALQIELDSLGYDTNIRNAGGWSTLGFLEDPILSNMLYRSDGALAELIIHELTHGTIFVRDSLRFNENLASFIGMEGALNYLKTNYMGDSLEFDNYLKSIRLKRRFGDHMVRGAQYLDSIYSNRMAHFLTYQEKDSVKRNAINNIVNSLDTIPEISNEYKNYLTSSKINNTYFLSYIRYRGFYKELKNELETKYNGDIKTMIDNYKLKYGTIL